MANEKIVRRLNEVLPRESFAESKYVISDSDAYIIEPRADGKYLITNEQGESWIGWYDLQDRLFHLESNGFEWVYNDATGGYEVYDLANGMCVDPSTAEYADGYFGCDPDSESCPVDQSVDASARWFVDSAADNETNAQGAEEAPKKAEADTDIVPAKSETSSKPKFVEPAPKETKPAEHSTSSTANPVSEHTSIPSPVISVTDSKQTAATAQTTMPLSHPDISMAAETSSAPVEVVSAEQAGQDRAGAQSEKIFLGAALYGADDNEGPQYSEFQTADTTDVSIADDAERGPAVATRVVAEVEEGAETELPGIPLAGAENPVAGRDVSQRETSGVRGTGESAAETIRTSVARQNPFDVERILTEGGEEFRFIGWPMIPVTSIEGAPMFAAVADTAQRQYEIQHVARHGDPRDQNGDSDKGGRRDREENPQQDAQEEAQA